MEIYCKNLKFQITYSQSVITINDISTYPIVVDSINYYGGPDHGLFVNYLLFQKTNGINYSLISNFTAGTSITINGDDKCDAIKAVAYIEYSLKSGESKVYQVGDYCMHDGDIYVNNSGAAIDSLNTDFDFSKWTLVTDIVELINNGVFSNEFPICTSNSINNVYLFANRVDDEEMKYSLSGENSFNGTFDKMNVEGVNYSSNNLVHTFVSEGIKTITVGFTDSYGVLFQKSYNLLVIKKIRAFFNAIINSTTVVFQNKSVGGATNYLWDFDDGTTSTDVNPTHIYQSCSIDKTYSVKLTVSKNIDGVVYSDSYTENVIIKVDKDCTTLYSTEYYTTECHSFITGNVDDFEGARKLFISDYEGNLLQTLDFAYKDEKLAFSVEKDGVYIAELWYVNDDGEKEVLLKAFPVYTFCDAEKCFEVLFNKLICCDDYCKDNCIDDETVRMRQAMMRLTVLLDLIKKYVFLEKNKYLGMTTITDDRKKYISKVVKYSNILALTVNRCNDCFRNNEIKGTCNECK